MPIRNADATWTGGLKDGTGQLKLASGAFQGKYSFSTRFEGAPGTNPEELIAAAHAACFSMALSAMLERAGHKAKSVHTTAAVSLDKVGEGFKITSIALTTDADVPDIADSEFQDIAHRAKTGCPVSQALAATEIRLTAKLSAH